MRDSMVKDPTLKTVIEKLISHIVECSGRGLADSHTSTKDLYGQNKYYLLQDLCTICNKLTCNCHRTGDI